MQLDLHISEKQYQAILEGKQTFIYGSLITLDNRYDVGTMVTLYPIDDEGNRIPGKFNLVVTYRHQDLEWGIVILSIIWITPPNLDAFRNAKHTHEINKAPLQDRGRSQTVKGVSIE